MGEEPVNYAAGTSTFCYGSVLFVIILATELIYVQYIDYIETIYSKYVSENGSNILLQGVNDLAH